LDSARGTLYDKESRQQDPIEGKAIHFQNGRATPVQKHLNDFNSIIADLESLDVKIKDEDKAILLVVSLPPFI